MVKGYSTFVGSPDVIPGIGRETIGCWPLLPDIFWMGLYIRVPYTTVHYGQVKHTFKDVKVDKQVGLLADCIL